MLKINGHKFYNVQKGLSVAEYQLWDVTYASDGVTDPVAVEVTHLI